MAVPETAVHEHGGAIARQDDVGAARQFAHVEAKAEAAAMQQAANQDFRLRVAPANAGHHPASGGGIHDVDHADSS
ncbi:conserved hypothetical protein [Paraburkholderia tropica]